MPENPPESTRSSVRIGQVWEDTFLAQPSKSRRWIVKVMKLNKKSARVEPCENDGWYTTAGHIFQYRMELRYFENGRMRLVKDTATDDGLAMTVRSVPVLDTGIGREMGYANDAEFIDVAEAERAEIMAMLSPEARERLERAERESTQRLLFGDEPGDGR